jgi:GDP-4-dehydro-6-deoxy-D-mannose reductase
MKAIIIGAAGFVGPYLAQAVKEYMNCEIVATKLPNEKVEIPEARIENLNILNPDEISAILSDEKPDYIFHLAAQSSVALSWKNPALTVDININGALNLLNMIRRLDEQPRVLIVGSGEEYGYIKEDMVPINENASLAPGNVYAITKATQNMMATIYAQAYGMNLVMTRSFNHMGPRQIAQFVVSDFCNQVVRIEKGLQEPLINVGNLSARRDFTDVRDVVRAYTLLIQYGRTGETYNVGSGSAKSIQEILDLILSKSEKNIEVRVDENKLRPVDVPLIEADISKTYRDTGWKPEIALETTIEDMLDYWRENL